MAILVGIIGFSGDGKTTSTIINPDGSIDLGEGYKGMNPSEHIIINCDKKELPFPRGMWSKDKRNYIVTDEFNVIKKVMEIASKDNRIKSLAIDTINSYLTYREFNDRRKLTFDQIY